MGLLDRLDPMQKQILMVGAPVVAVFAFGAMRKPAPAADETSSGTKTGGTAGGGGLTTGWTMPSTDAIGVGQLSDFESTLTGYLNDLAVKVETQGDLIAKVPAPTSTTTVIYQPLPAPPPETAPAPAPPPPPPVCYPPSWGISGEVTIARLESPNGGCWFISNWGGVHNSGGAPHYGSCLQNNNMCRIGPGYENPPRYIVSAQNSGSGYRMISTRGETYTFP